MRIPGRYRSVALVGIDGSGKTTQAENLRRLLAQRPGGARVFAVHPFGRKLLRVGTSSPVLPVRVDLGPSVEKPGLLRRMIAAADMLDIASYLWLVHVRAAYASFLDRGREVWLVGDRSMEDVLVKHLRQGTISDTVAALVRRVIPRFDVTVWLEVDPAVAMERDKDFDLAYYEGLHAAYSAAAKRLGWRVVADRRRASAPGRAPERRRYPGVGRPRDSVFAAVVGELGLDVPASEAQDSLRAAP